MVHYDGCFNIFPDILRGNKCITTKVAACKHVAYVVCGGLEKQRGSPPNSSYSWGNTVNEDNVLSI